jgi:CP family cyanate transporter-like MFS transporter
VKFLRWYAPVALVAVTFNLRAGLLTVGPVLPAIVRGLALSPAESGVLTALPILVLGLASAAAVPVGRVLGWSGGLVFAMALTAAGIRLRSAGSDVTLFAGAALLGIGIGLGNVFVPTLVKERFSGRIGLAMGLYSMLLTTGALVAVKLTPPLFAHFGDWRPTLAAFALPAFVAAAVATPLAFEVQRPPARARGMSLWGNPVAWAVTAFMGLQSAFFYAFAQWAGALLADRGIGLVDIAADLGAFYFTQFMGALALPIALTKSGRQDLVAAAIVACAGAAAVGILYGPPAAIFACSAVLGLAIGGVFAAALTFQVIRARTASSAARLSSMAQCAGYIIASAGPLVLGLVSRWPNARFASMLWLVALALFTAVAAILAGRPRFVDDAALALPARA